MNLEGKKALVTGASRGIGKAIAMELALLGADVAINYNNSAEKAEEVATEIRAMGRKSLTIQADVSKFEEAEALVNKVNEEFGQIDILVNNAGITKDTLLLKMKEEQFDDVISANLKSTFNCTKVAIKLMMKKKYGRIINVASVVGITGNAGQANYAASKAGVIGFTKSTAIEIGSRGITVNAIAPGYIETDMTDNLNEKVKEQLLGRIPLKKLGQPKDVANLVAFLASDNAEYITGQVIKVDGGMVTA